MSRLYTKGQSAKATVGESQQMAMRVSAPAFIAARFALIVALLALLVASAALAVAL